MQSLGVKINYLYNSGFTVEIEKYFLIFDYFKDEVDDGKKSLSKGAIGEEDLKIDKNIIVFASHSHADHFNPVVLEWRKIRHDIDYVLSSDIKLDNKGEKINFLSAYEELRLKDIYVKAYGSTDLGISFLVRGDGKTIFHAGDLNWWYWWDDTQEEIKKAEVWFKDEIEKIKVENIDITFFPVDPRLEHNYYLGAEYFIKTVGSRILIPMHFGDDYNSNMKFKQRASYLPTEVISISGRGQEINL